MTCVLRAGDRCSHFIVFGLTGGSDSGKSCMSAQIYKNKSKVLLYYFTHLHQNGTEVQSKNSGCSEIVGTEHVTFSFCFLVSLITFLFYWQMLKRLIMH